MREYKYEIIAGLLGVALLVFWFFAPLIAQTMYSNWHAATDFNSDLASFGDSYAVFNGLISGLALAAIVAAIWIQAEQLREQRREVARTLENLKRQEEADDLRFTIDSAPVLQKLMLDEFRMLVGEGFFIDSDLTLDPDETSLERELSRILESQSFSLWQVRYLGSNLNDIFIRDSYGKYGKPSERQDAATQLAHCTTNKKPLEHYHTSAQIISQRIEVALDQRDFSSAATDVSGMMTVLHDCDADFAEDFIQLHLDHDGYKEYPVKNFLRELENVTHALAVRQKAEEIFQLRELLRQSIRTRLEPMLRG